ncbi:hypothetical protein SAMN05216481_1176 [Streptomyces radiopugnans]|uniref:Uncharacterized protein n=1 Tax=Streptomyces radiopugnans TaxID=403935 RepID=A0A1H9JB92_9ACTN|nr:hypothetical protein SAMN05216481_1176 [Streptomyces radiopugnans]
MEHSIDDLLSYAQVGERVTEEDIAAPRRQIEREIAATIWQGALSCESSAHTANTYLGRTPYPDRTRPRSPPSSPWAPGSASAAVPGEVTGCRTPPKHAYLRK